MKKKILFIYINYSSFVKTDFEILATYHEVSKYQFKPVKGFFKTGFELIKQLFFLIFKIWKFDIIYIWFADHHSFFPILLAKIFGKKSYVVIGGYDVARIPSLDYGVFTSRIRGYFAIQTMKNCTVNLTVSKYVQRKVKWLANNSKTQLIYNCVNILDNSNIQFNKEMLVLTVGLIDSERTFYLKGIDTFTEVARELPQIKFIVVGISNKLTRELIKSCPSNLELIDRVEHNKLNIFYKRAKIYCQLSRSESFGVSILEAMYFGCIPIVSNVGGMPEIIEKNGIIIKHDLTKQAIEIINKIILSNYNVYAIKNSVQKFDIQIRKNLLLSLIDA